MMAASSNALLHIVWLDFAAATDEEWRSAEQQLERLDAVPAVSAFAVSRDLLRDRVLVLFVRIDSGVLASYVDAPLHREIAVWLQSVGVTSVKTDVPAAIGAK